MHRLRVRIFVFVVALLAVVLLVSLLLVQRAAYQNAIELVERQAEALGMDLLEVFRLRAASQQRLVELLAGPEVEGGIGSSGSDQLQHALLRDRAGASALARFAADGTLAWSSLADGLPTPPWSRIAPVASETRFKRDGDHLWLVSQTPVSASQHAVGGRLVLVVLVDDGLLGQLWGRRGGAVSIVSGGSGELRVHASSLGSGARSALASWSLDTLASVHPRLADLGEQAGTVVRLGDAPEPIHAIVLLALPQVLADHRLLQWQLLAVGLLALVVAAFGALLIGDSISRPLSAMVRHMRVVGRGDFSAPPVAIERRGEIGALAREFAFMLSSIEDRERSIRHMAFHDALTGLANRNRFAELVEQAVKDGVDRRFAVLVLDIDRFREINDTLGHVAGDQVLKQVAARLAHRCRAEDSLARLSGDQFAILARDLPSTEVMTLVQRYRETFADPVAVEGVSLDLSTSMGIAVHPEHGQHGGILLQRAEIAMYLAKTRRVGCMLYTPELDRHSLLRLTLMAELRGAIERNQLELYVQPKLDIRGWRIVGLECLVRWVHPQHGFVPPDEFIPLAEQTGNIRRLTDWIIVEALEWSRRWREAGFNLCVSVNLSTIDLNDPVFPHRIAALLAERSLPFETLMLEVTESAVMDEPERALPVLAQLRDLGIGLSIDDFGTGYSSMAQLKRLPVDELKIDKSFVFDLVNNPDDAVIVRSIIEIGHNMELKVVAEGVETEASLEYLTRLGCDLAQGYFLSRPMPAREFAGWLRETPYLFDSGED